LSTAYKYILYAKKKKKLLKLKVKNISKHKILIGQKAFFSKFAEGANESSSAIEAAQRRVRRD
jgi:hypothetical protein